MNNIFKYTLALLLIAGISTGCDNFLEPSVDQNRPTETAIQTVNDMNSVVLGIHDDLNRVELYGRDYVAGPEAMSDNAFSDGNSGRFIVNSQYNFTVNSGYALGIWDVFYESIASANVLINSDLPDANQSQVDYAKGQAYALRAFAHMNLLLNFGQQFSGGTLGIPYITTYNEGNLIPEREPVADVWNKIGADFTEAASLMDPALDAMNSELNTAEPALMNYYAVKGLQSRYYLYTGEFGEAISAADAVINSGVYSLVAAGDLTARWASGTGPSSLFELGFTSTDRLGTDNVARIFRESNYGDVEATADLYNSYDPSDARLSLFSVNGDTIRVSGKYVDELGSDNVRVLRYAEVWLNKAEALARRGNGSDLQDAIDMINTLSTARGVADPYSLGTKAEVIDDVLAERRLELAFEGHRYFDLLRHGKDLPYVTIPSQGAGNNFITGASIPFGDQMIVLPIPQTEMDANSSMEQNPYYE